MPLPKPAPGRNMRLCIIGNSHVAALRRAWAQYPGRWPGICPAFVAAPRSLLLHTMVRDGRLVPTSPATLQALQRLGGNASLDLSAHDVFVIVGGSMTLLTAVQPYRDARWPGLPSVADCPDLVQRPQRLISGQAAQAIVLADLSQRMGVQLAERLRTGTICPICLVEQPRLSDEVRTTRHPAARLHKIAIRAGDATAIARLFETAATAALAPSGTRFLPQPAQTVSQQLFTASRYMTGSERLDPVQGALHDRDDMTHANANYGALVLDQIMSALTVTIRQSDQAKATSGTA